MPTAVQIGGRRFARGEKGACRIPLGKSSYGAELFLPCTVVTGKREGSRLVLVFCQHGDEVSPLSGWYHLYNSLNPDEIAGEVIAVTVANPSAFEARLRNSWVDALHGDHGNMNRAWPGCAGGWYVERLSYAMERELLRDPCQCVIDFHDGTAHGLEIFYGYANRNADTDHGRKACELSIGFGMDLLIGKSLVLRGTLSEYLESKGIPHVGVEIGYFYGFDGGTGKVVRTPEETTITGIRNVMKLLSMIGGTPELPAKQAVVQPETRVKPSNGGLLVPRVSRKDIGRVFPREAVLFDLVDVSTMELIEQGHGPYQNNVLISAPGGAMAVNLGDHGCHVADASTLEWIVNEAG